MAARYSDENSTWWDGYLKAVEELEAKVKSESNYDYDEIFVGTLRKWLREMRDGERNSENL